MEKIQVQEFKKLLMKATLNNSIGSVQFEFDNGRVKSKLMSQDDRAIVILDKENDIISADNVSFYFLDPYTNINPFLNLIEDAEADLIIRNEKITIKNGPRKADLHFCDPSVVKTFGANEARSEGHFFTMEINEVFLNAFKDIKKIGARFKKVYFNVEGGVFSIETADKTNMFSNGLKVNLAENVESNDLSICFDFRYFVNLMTVINGEAEEFKMDFYYLPDPDLGLLAVIKEDETEKYYIMSQNDIN